MAVWKLAGCVVVKVMLSAAQAGDVSLLQQLLDTGHSINETNYDCVTPLHEACLAGRLECVQFLLLCGANVSPPLNLIVQYDLFYITASGWIGTMGKI